MLDGDGKKIGAIHLSFRPRHGIGRHAIVSSPDTCGAFPGWGYLFFSPARRPHDLLPGGKGLE